MKQNINILLKKREKIGLEIFFFFEYSNNIQDVYKNIDEYNPNRKLKVLITFDDTIADMISNKNFK